MRRAPNRKPSSVIGCGRCASAAIRTSSAARITINQTEYVIVGVAPEGFRGHLSGLDDSYYQLWLPLSRHPRLRSPARDEGPGVSD